MAFIYHSSSGTENVPGKTIAEAIEALREHSLEAWGAPIERILAHDGEISLAWEDDDDPLYFYIDIPFNDNGFDGWTGTVWRGNNDNLVFGPHPNYQGYLPPIGDLKWDKKLAAYAN